MDEREGLPSSSIAERLWLCPGSWKMGRGLPELVTPEMQLWAQSGDRIHLWLQAPDLVDLSPWPEELEIAQACAQQREDLVEQVFAPTRAVLRAADFTEFREERFWFYRGSRRLFSGKADYASLMALTALVVDYKTGRGDVAESARNMQLRSLAVMFWITKTLRRGQEVYVAIIQPLTGKPELCRYGREELLAAERELITLLRDSLKSDAPLRPGEKQCKFCPAKLKCPAAAEVFKSVSGIEVTRLLGLSAQDLSDLLVRCKVAKQLIHAAESQAKAILKEDPAALPNWALKPGAPVREVTDALGAFEALHNAGLMDRDTYLKECVSVGIGALEAAVANRNAMKRHEAKEALNNHLQAFINLKPKEPSLEKIE